MGSRRKGRELALQALYAMEFSGQTLATALTHIRALCAEPPSEDEDLAELVRANEEAIAFATTLVRGVANDKDALDALIGRCSTNWKIPRMAIVDRNILRLAAYELLHVTDIPPKVTLNEAIEIGKRYGTGDSSAFINGILDRIAATTAKRPAGDRSS